MAPDIFVIGAGVAGLTLARDLARGGRRVHVVERNDRIGGQVASLPVGPHLLDAAAESFATRTDAVAGLIAELGLSREIVFPLAAPAWIYHNRLSVVPLPSTGLLGVPSSPLAPDVRAAIGRRAAARAWADRLLPRHVGSTADSFGELVTARMGPAVTRALVAPITRGVHSTEPDHLPIRAAHPDLPHLIAQHGSLAKAVAHIRAASPAGSAVASLRGGMHTLPAAIAASAVAAGADIHLGVLATDIASDRVTFGGRRHRGEVIVAAPVPTTPTREVTVVTLFATAPAWQHAPRGTGVLVAKDARDVHARALTHVSAKWQWVSRAFAGQAVVRLSYDSAVADPAACAIADATALLGSAPDIVHEVLARTWRRGAPSPTAERAGDAGPARTGESISGTGLAAVIEHARSLAARTLQRELAA